MYTHYDANRLTHMMCKKSDTKDYVSCDLMYVKCPGQANLQRQKQGKWGPRAAGRGMGSDRFIGTGFLLGGIQIF